TGNGAGCYAVAGPTWTGVDAPKGVARLFRSETDFSLVIYRTQVFGPSDMANVAKVQKGYKVQPLSKFLGQPPPAAAPHPSVPAWSDDAAKARFPEYLDCLLQFARAVPAETELRARFARIGIGPRKRFAWSDLSPAHKLELGKGSEAGFKKIEAARDSLGK